MKADRKNAGKARLDLIALPSLEGAARVLEFGSGKYSDWNWAKGADWSVPIASLLRHLSAMQMGELTDPESGELHADHILCNAIYLAHYARFFPELNDLPNLQSHLTTTGESHGKERTPPGRR